MSETATKEAQNWAMFIHLSGLCHYLIPIPGAAIILPLILWNVKKDESSFIEEHGREAINFQISILIYAIGAFILAFAFIGFLLLPAVALFQIIASVMAALKANDGKTWRYPLCIRML